ncbi:phosphoribosylglycinamide formyltransferase 2 domain protein [Mycobacterium xenopi 3993]|nr:phosphoribosylglycinamide formyltransferase 2 domain protein [Mycobacterium xenopi 3993]
MMLLGAGELSRELVIVFQRFGAEVIAVEHYADAPAHRVADQSLVVKITDADELSAVIGRVQPNFVVALTDAVAADALAAAARPVSPRWSRRPRRALVHRQRGTAATGRRRIGAADRAVLVRRFARRTQSRVRACRLSAAGQTGACGRRSGPLGSVRAR